MDNVQSAEKRFYQKPWFAVSLLLVAGFLYAVTSSGGGSSTSVASNDANSPQEIGEVGADAYLRLPNNPDKSQVICLAPTKEVFDEYSKALMANDTVGVMELADHGLFCVGNGSKVKVIDRDYAIRRVRVVEGVNPVDADKVGQSGWVVKEWVVNR